MLKYFDKDVAFVQSFIKCKKGIFKKGVELNFKIKYPEFFVCYGHNVIFRTKPLLEVGGFENTIGEDFIVSVKIFEKGYKSLLARDCISYEENPKTLKEFILREIKWSSAEPLYLRLIPKIWKTRIPIVKKIEITLDFLRGFIALILAISTFFLFFIRVDEILFFIIYFVFGFIPLVPEMLIFSPSLLFSTAIGYIKGLIKKPEFIPTNELKNKYTFYFNILILIYLILSSLLVCNIIRNFNPFISSFILFSILTTLSLLHKEFS